MRCINSAVRNRTISVNLVIFACLHRLLSEPGFPGFQDFQD